MFVYTHLFSNVSFFCFKKNSLDTYVFESYLPICAYPFSFENAKHFLRFLRAFQSYPMKTIIEKTMALEFNVVTFSFLQSSVFTRHIVRIDGGPIDQFANKELHFKLKRICAAKTRYSRTSPSDHLS